MSPKEIDPASCRDVYQFLWYPVGVFLKSTLRRKHGHISLHNMNEGNKVGSYGKDNRDPHLKTQTFDKHG